MGSKNYFNLDEVKNRMDFAGGSMTVVTQKEVPNFVDISFALLKLNKNGQTEAIWHTNASKMGYCQQGHAMVTIRSPQGVEVFTVEEGDIFFIPKGYMHFIANICNGETIIAFAVNHTAPQTMRLANALLSLTDSVFAATFNTPAEFLEGLKKGKKQDLIFIQDGVKETPHHISDRYKFSMGATNKTIETKGGYLLFGTQSNLPVLDGLGLLGFGLQPKGCVEPHWHTNSGELIYVIKGKTKISVLAPDGNLEILEVNAGQGAYAPQGHFHNIENVGNEEMVALALFSTANPDYIGIGEAVGACSNDLLASMFNVDPSYFEQFKKTNAPLVIVPV